MNELSSNKYAISVTCEIIIPSKFDFQTISEAVLAFLICKYQSINHISWTRLNTNTFTPTQNTLSIPLEATLSEWINQVQKSVSQESSTFAEYIFANQHIDNNFFPNQTQGALFLQLENTSQKIIAHTDTEKNHWPKWRVTELLKSYQFLMGNIFSLWETPLKNLSITSPSQWAWFQQWNNTAADYDTTLTITDRIDQTTQNNPEAIAVISNSRCLTYRELTDLSNQVADHLLKLNLPPTHPIGILGNKSKGWEIIIGLLGILKAGFAYLPLNPLDPRITEIIYEANANYILAQPDSDKTFLPETCHTIDIRAVLAESSQDRAKNFPKYAPDNIAYIIYTSGSTGKPKGVAITHTAALNTIDDMITRLNLTTQDRLLALSGLGFDLSVFDLFGSFISGAALVLLDETHNKNPEAWMHTICDHHVTIWNSVPALMTLLLEYLENHSSKFDTLALPLRWILLSGDLIPPNLLKKIKRHTDPACQTLALGGSTEASIWSIGSNVSHWDVTQPLPYGRPLKNQKIYICDNQGLLLPAGAIGEIVIAGIGLAQSYWQNVSLTQERFPHYKNIGKVFLCRDYGFINSNTALTEFMGRLDRQTKIHGHRLDLTEIEKALTTLEAIEEAILIDYQDTQGTAKLAAMLKRNALSQEISNQLIKQKLAEHLPVNIIPQKYYWFNEWPLTTNGKVDVNALKNLAINHQGKYDLPQKTKALPTSISTRRPEKIFLPAHPTQAGMIYEIQKDNASIYMMAFAFHYNTHLDPQCLQQACNILLTELNALQQSFSFIEEFQAYAVIMREGLNFPYYYFDWHNYSQTETEQWLAARKSICTQNGFHLNHPQLFYLEHFCLPGNKDRICLYASHLLFEAGSTTKFIERLNMLYTRIKNHQTLPEISQSNYANFLTWRAKYDLKEHLQFWQKEISQLTESSLLAPQANLPKIKNSTSTCITNVEIKLTETEKAQIEVLCSTQHVSKVSFMQACWSLFLAFWLDRKEVVSGLIYSGRNNLPDQFKNTFGLFITTLPFIISVEKDLNFAQWLTKIKTHIQSLKQHDIVSLFELNQLSEIKVSEYFDSAFTALNFPRPDISETNALVKVEYDPITQFPLMISFDPIAMELQLSFSQNNFSETQRQLISHCYHWIIQQALTQPEKKLKNFSLINPHQNSDLASIVYGKQIHDAFDIITSFQEQVKKNPTKIAFIDNDQSCTYQQMSDDIAKLANYFQQHLRHSRLAIMLPRSYSFVITLLASLQANISIIPLNIESPIARLQEQLNISECHHIITQDIHKKFVDTVQTHDYLKILAQSTHTTKTNHLQNKNALAYILFTSGSSGKPKAVNVARHALNNNIAALIDALKLSENDVWLSITQTTFDIVLLEILAPLCIGGTLLFPSNEAIMSAESLTQFIQRYAPTHLQTTPSRWKIFSQQKLPLNSFQALLVGGEPFPQDLLIELTTKQKPIINLYGPTEATIWTSFALLHPNDPIHIGKPIANTWCTIINQYHQILPKGVPGELCIGGAGLAEGYLDKQQTEEAFVEIQPFPSHSMHVYKTGDRAWIDEHACIHFMNRKDRQLKIRGQRLDPIEIENAIIDTKLVENAVVISSPSDIHTLIAFLQPQKMLSQPCKLSIFCFPEVSAEQKNIFRFYQALASQADSLGLYGMWIPERHFDEVGSPFSATAVVASSLASITKQLVLGAGSIVLPLHHPIEILEQWATLDCISQGRIRFSGASGWNPNDFIFNPENYPERKKILFENLKIIKESWESGIYQGKNGLGESRTVEIFPRPVQKVCPLWVTVAEDTTVFAEAGRLGLNILTHLLMQNIDDLAKKIKVYHHNLKENGFNPADYQVTLMVHTYLHEDAEIAKQQATLPLTNYFRSHFRLLLNAQEANTTFQALPEEHLNKAVAKFIEEKSLIGNLKQAEIFVKKLQAIGINEIACLVDFGIPQEKVLTGLTEISKLNITPKKIHGDFDLEKLRQHLHTSLPSTMIPNDYIIVDTIPLTTHGKINFSQLASIADKYKLENPTEPLFQLSDQDSLTQQVFSLWCTVLRRQSIDPELSFFDNGGHSLKAIELLNKIESTLQIKIPLNQFLNNPWLKDCVAYIRQQQPEKNIKEKAFPIENILADNLPLSPMQKGVWVFNQLFPDAVCYHDAFLYEVSKKFSSQELEKALNHLFNNDPVFRIYFLEQTGNVFQRISNTAPKVHIQHYARTSPHHSTDDAEFWSAIQNSAKMSFDLTQPPLLRATLYCFTDKIFLQLVVQHLLTDGQSIINLINRLEAFLSQASLPKQPHYLEYIQTYFSSAVEPDFKERKCLVENYIKQMKLTRLENTFHSLKKRSAQRSFTGFQHAFTIEKKSFAQISMLARQSNTTINTVLLAAFSRTVLSQINEETTQITLPISLREPIWQACIGLFINFGVMSIQQNEAKKWTPTEWIEAIKLRSIFLLEHRNIYFSEIASVLGSTLITDTQPLSQFVFNAVHQESPSNQFKLVPIDYATSRFDLELQAISSAQEIILTFIFSHDIFSLPAGNNFIQCFLKELSWLTNTTSTIIPEENSIIGYWRTIYDGMYRKITDLPKQTWLGWNSSIHHKAFTEATMKDWQQDILAKINRRPLGRVLEIGCGTGAILQAIRDRYTSYLGIDFSPSIITKNIQEFHSANTEFKILLAHKIDTLAAGQFDTIIMNSVVQYFPDLEYLQMVIHKSLHLINSAGGQIIIGDLRNKEWQKTFYQALSGKNDLTGAAKTFEDYLLTEKELFVSPYFSTSLLNYPNIAAAIPEPKFMRTKNELSRFRFDLTIYVAASTDETSSHASVLEIDGSSISTLSSLTALVRTNIKQAEAICITGLTNPHITGKGLNPTLIQNKLKALKLNGYVLLDPNNANLFFCYVSMHEKNFFQALKAFFLQRYSAAPQISTIETSALPEQISAQHTTEQIQIDLIMIWQSLLQISHIRLTDNFFDLGGDSMMYIRLFNQIIGHGYTIKMPDLLVNRTLASQIKVLSKSQ